MLNIGMPEMLLIAAIALIVIGPKKLPDMARSIGRAFGEFKRATSDFKESLSVDHEMTNVKSAFDELNAADNADKKRESDDTAVDIKSPIDSVSDPAADNGPENDKQSIKGDEQIETFTESVSGVEEKDPDTQSSSDNSDTNKEH